MSLEHAILGLLSWRPLTGYDLKKMFAGSAVLYWSGNNNQIYTTLVKLLADGLVTRTIEDQQEGPVRKVYHISPGGQAALKTWLLTEPDPPQLKNSFLIQLAWADLLDPHELDGLLARYEDEMQVQLAMLHVQGRTGNLTPGGTPRDAYINPALARTPREAVLWSMIQENWISFYEHELDWVKRLRAKFAGL